MKIYKREGKTKTSWQIYYHGATEGRKIETRGQDLRHQERAADYAGKVRAAKRENRYHDVFDVKKESVTTFDKLCDLYEENYRTQRSWPSKKIVINLLRDDVRG